jgi:type IV pilus assembly protein PilM
MMPWNPIHRYAGLQSSIEPIVVEPAVDDSKNVDLPYAGLDGATLMSGVTSDPFWNGGGRDVDVSFGHATGLGRAAGAEPPRRPLGFVDVRSEAGEDGSHEFEASTHEPEAAENIFGDVEVADEKVPFFKREISFGRKKASEHVIEAASEREAEADADAEPVAEPADVPSEWAVEPVVAEAETAGPDITAEEKVPFFKRELSIRRKRDAAASETVDPANEADSEEPDAIEVDAHVVAEHVVAEPAVAEPVVAEQEEAELPVGESADVAADSILAQIDGPSIDESNSDEPGEIEVDADLDERDSDLADGLEWPEQVAPAAEIAIPESPDLESSGQGDTGPVDETDPVAPVEIPVVAAVAKVPLHKREFGKSRGTKTGKSSSSGRGSQRRGGKTVGLKIGASQLAAAVVEDQNGRPELVELARTPLEAGIVVDGEIRDPEALTNALRTFFADNNLPTKDVRIGIASNRIGVRTFEIAGVEDGSRFDNAVRFKAHEVLPIAGSESVLDYRVLDERQSPTGETTRRILLVVAPRDQVAPYAEAAQRAGLKLAGIDLESLGLLRAFVEPQDASDRKATDTATVVVAIGHEASTLMVSGGGVCEFTRVFDWGGNTMQDAIAQELDVRPAEAATILRHLSLGGNATRIEGLDDDARNKAIEAVRLRLTPFARELVSSLQFYQTQPDSLGIGEIVITGGASQLDGLADALNQMIGVAVRVGDPLQRVSARKGVEAGFENVIGSLSVAIGLGIDDGAIRSVNLMPGDLAKVSTRKPLRLAPVLLPIAAVVPLAAVGFLFYQAHGKVSDRQAQLSSLNAEFAALPAPKLPQIDTALRGLQAQRATAVAQVLGARTSWDSMLADFARVLPANVWLTSLSAKTAQPLTTPIAVAAAPGATGTAPVAAPAPTVAVTPTGVTINGYTYAQPDVATLLARLSALPSLQNVQLQGSSVTQIGKRNVVQFTILADLRESGGVS